MSLVQTPLIKKNLCASQGVGAGEVGTMKETGLGVGAGVGSQSAGTTGVGSEQGQGTGTSPDEVPLDPLELPLDPLDIAGAKQVHPLENDDLEPLEKEAPLDPLE